MKFINIVVVTMACWLLTDTACTSVSGDENFELASQNPPNGLPESWLSQFFGSDFATNTPSSALADPDEDGANNYYEYISGTNPLDSHDYPKVIPLSVSTFAGSTAGGQDGYRTNATFYFPSTLAVDRENKIWVTECTMTGFTSSGEGGHRIRVIDTNGMVTTISGSSTPGFADGPAETARYSAPNGLAFDSKGNAFIVDRVNSLIRKMDTNGTVTTFAGTLLTYAHKDGQGTNACFNTPTSVCIDSNDNLYIADFGNYKIRKITPDGWVSTYAGAGAGYLNGEKSQANFNTPSGIAIDPAGNLHVADWLNGALRRIDTNGIVTTFATGLSYVEAAFIDQKGFIYATIPGSKPGLYKYRSDGSLEWSIRSDSGVVDGPIGAARISRYAGIVEMPDGNLLVSDSTDIAHNSYRLRLIKMGFPPLLSLNQSAAAATENAIMTLTTPAPNGIIRYTLDGSIPNSNSPAYDHPLEVLANTSLTARLFANNAPVSDIVSNSHSMDFTIKIDSIGSGSVTRNPSLLAYASNTVVQLIAIPNPSYVFDGWSGDITASSNSASILMNGNKVVAARFAPLYNLSIIPSTGGSVTSNPNQFQFKEGDKVLLTANPNPGYVFDRWITPFTGSTNPIEITITTNLSVQAAYSRVVFPSFSPAEAKASVFNGIIVGITVGNGGYGYTTDASVIISGGGGTGAAARATITNGSIENITVLDAGIGYTSTPSILVVNTPASLNRDLIAYYPFNGSANDALFNKFHGTVTGAKLTTDRYGSTNSAYRFTDASTTIQMPVDFKNSQNITLSVWIKFDSIAKGQTFFAQDYAQNGILFGYNTDGCFGLWLSGTNNWFIGATAKATPIIGKWYLITATYDGSNIKVYVDGVLSGQKQHASGIYYRTDHASRFGDGVTLTGYPMRGTIDDARIYGRALSSDEVALLYASEVPVDASLSIEVKIVRIMLQGLKIGRKYQLEATKNVDASYWSPVGAPFTATATTISQEVEVQETGRLFRIFEIQ